MAQSESEILGTTTITDRYRISLIKAARDALDADIDEGDRLVYRRVGDRLVIEPA